jgi:uncharacterized protein
MNVVNWFEIPVVDLARAKAFYAQVFERELADLPSPPGMEMSAFPWEEGAANAAGALVRSEQHVPAQTGTRIYFQCDDVATELGRVEAAGGKALTPKMAIGEWGHIAQIQDTEGNIIGLHSQT